MPIPASPPIVHESPAPADGYVYSAGPVVIFLLGVPCRICRCQCEDRLPIELLKPSMKLQRTVGQFCVTNTARATYRFGLDTRARHLGVGFHLDLCTDEREEEVLSGCSPGSDSYPNELSRTSGTLDGSGSVVHRQPPHPQSLELSLSPSQETLAD